ncbi:low specificity L-threonine aldolase [Enterovirga sp.]|uniref:threonine aldolase family protein n=1 Tax=Enterovirga sp. TaxID=2026350 RepID=UPI00262C11E1|nr:low specificity L-threonine aldolase [Enterovirga sp.]MDB5590079.1 Threonine aldolase [Enterovirga sp.]
MPSGDRRPALLNFASDNVWGASEPVLRALVDGNAGPLPSYGADPLTRRLADAFAALFEHEVAVFPVATGTAANALALSAALSPFGLCVCHEEAHVIDDECGAPEFFAGGAKLLGLPGTGCKLDPERLAATLDGLPRHEKQMPAEIVSISQATESGVVYRPEEIAALSAVCRARGLVLHMDGARLANALVTLGCSAAEMTWRAGIDILSFGGTKNGCLAAEAVICFDPKLARTLGQRRKRGGHTLSKARLIAAQFLGYLQDDHWLANARQANAMAGRLAEGLRHVPGIRLAWPTEANEVFVILPDEIDRRLRQAGAVFHPWSGRALAPETTVGPGESLARLVTSFATEADDVDALLRIAAPSGGIGT